MRFENPECTRQEAEPIFSSGSVEEICSALVGVTLSGEDFEWVQDQCMALARHSARAVRAVSAVCLGHLARIHGQLDLARARPILDDLAREPELAGTVEDAWDDIHRFLGLAKDPVSKDEAILDLLAKLQIEARGWVLVDHWDADRCAIGIAHASDPRTLIYVSTFGTSQGRYDYECERPAGPSPEDYVIVEQGENVDLDHVLKAAERLLGSFGDGSFR